MASGASDSRAVRAGHTPLLVLTFWAAAKATEGGRRRTVMRFSVPSALAQTHGVQVALDRLREELGRRSKRVQGTTISEGRESACVDRVVL